MQERQVSSRAASIVICEYLLFQQIENMATYWISQPKKHCDFCHCWIADNKASVDFHERGKRHQENVEKKLKELRKKGQEQYKMQQTLDEDLIKMETEALKAFKKDLANDPALAAEYRAKAAAASASAAASMKKKEELLNAARKLHKQGMAATKSTKSASKAANSVTPSSTASSTPSTTTALSPAASASNDTSEPQGATQCVWLEGTSPEGDTYYWNTVTGESQWEKPEGYKTTDESTIYRSEVTTQQGQRAEVTTEAEEANLITKQTKVPEILAPPGCEDEEPAASDDQDEDKKEVTVREGKGREEENTQRAAKRRLGNPYGGWTTIIRDDTPPVDLQLPQSDRPTFQPVVPQAAQLQPREKITFKERTVSSLNASKPASSSASLGSGEASFKKRKFGGAGRSIRQRDADT